MEFRDSIGIHVFGRANSTAGVITALSSVPVDTCVAGGTF
jgi:hypothetical protein